MGFFSWLLKNGPGSPGSTAKSIVGILKKMPNNTGTWPYPDYGFAEIIEVRKAVERETGLYSLLSSYDTTDLIRVSKGNLSLLIFQIMFLETSQFRRALTSSEIYSATTNTIREVVKEQLPQRQSIFRDPPCSADAFRFASSNMPL